MSLRQRRRTNRKQEMTPCKPRCCIIKVTSESCHCLQLQTFGQSDDTRDDDEDQSKQLDEGQGDLSAWGHGHAPAVDCHYKCCIVKSGAACQSWLYGHAEYNCDSESLTHSEDADQPDQRHGRRARRKERLHHISAESQAHVRGHSWPAKQKEKKRLLERSWRLI